MLIGDKIYCHTNCVVKLSKNVATTAGNYYTIIEIGEDIHNEKYIKIINDNNIIHSFSIEKYKNWFLNIKEERKEKIKKLNSL